MNKPIKTFTSRLATLVFVQAHTMTLLLGVCGLALSIGFILGSPTNANYSTISSFADQSIWAFWFLIYSIIKLLQPLVRVWHSIKILNALQGIWAWSFIFLSFTVFDSTPIAPTELMLVIPIICELWELVVDIFNFRTCPHRRKGDYQ